jgi:GNAT superfamily N-acetyltransferase
MANNLLTLRQQVRPLLHLSAPQDGLAAYYTLYHDPARTRLCIEERAGYAEGFLTICQTGRDLFRLLAVLRARHGKAAAVLLERELTPRRPYYLLTTPDLRPIAEEALEVEQVVIGRIYQLDLKRYNPTISVLVLPARSSEASPRFVIRSQGKVAAEAGVNWCSPHFAEVYVWTAPEARGRGWGKAVLESCVSWALRSGVQPLYTVSEDNEPSIRLAESVGFVDTGAQQLSIEGIAGKR